jgi:hypothetical protein
MITHTKKYTAFSDTHSSLTALALSRLDLQAVAIVASDVAQLRY